MFMVQKDVPEAFRKQRKNKFWKIWEEMAGSNTWGNTRFLKKNKKPQTNNFLTKSHKVI